jgi:hypothetical protein
MGVERKLPADMPRVTSLGVRMYVPDNSRIIACLGAGTRSGASLTWISDVGRNM